MAGTLGVATLTYAPFCFFNLINPLVAALYGWANISIVKLESSAPLPAAPAAPGRPGRRPGVCAVERRRLQRRRRHPGGAVGR